jgi:hypothetical protein
VIISRILSRPLSLFKEDGEGYLLKKIEKQSEESISYELAARIGCLR